MKKVLIFCLAFLFLAAGVAEAKQYRVCSKTEAHAHFSKLSEAVSSLAVFDGDTIYVEPGHYESGNIEVNKQLYIFGPGYYLLENGIEAMNEGSAVFANSIYLQKVGTVISGCKVMDRIDLDADGTKVTGCFVGNGSHIDGDNCVIEDSYYGGDIYLPNTYYHHGEGSIIQNNIIKGRFTSNDNRSITAVVVRNNTIVHAYWDQYGSAFGYLIQPCFKYSEIYNNIIINTSTQYAVTQGEGNTIDTMRGADCVFHPDLLTLEADNSIHHNIVSCRANSALRNSVFDKRAQDVLVWDNATTNEGRYKHNASSGAEGAGLNGTTIGAYGSSSGSRPYTAAGIPQYRPYIIDAVIDDMPSEENTINASFKIKIQQ